MLIGRPDFYRAEKNFSSIKTKTLISIMSSSTQLQPFQPAIDVFTNKVGQVNAKLTQNINSFKQVDEDRSDLISEVMEYEIRGARGRLVKHLIGFALDPNWWSVYAQQYNKNKMPFIIQEKPLRKVVYTYRRIKAMMEEDANCDDVVDSYIRAFEYSIVRDVSMYVAFNSTRVDFGSKWKSQHMSFKQLSDKPLKYHKVWKYFFTDPDNKSIPKLVDDIERILTFHTRSKILSSSTHHNFENSGTVIEESSNILNKGMEFLQQSNHNEESIEHFNNSVSVSDITHVDEQAIMRVMSDNAIEQEIIKALYDEEAAEDSGSDSGDDSDDESGDDDDGEMVEVFESPKRKAVVMDPTPITNMMETLVDNVKRQKTETQPVVQTSLGPLAMEPPRNSISTKT